MADLITIADYIEEMRKIAATAIGDRESAHSNADTLVLKLLRYVTPGAANEIEDFIAAYDFDKWYA